MEYVVGTALAFGVLVFARVVGFDRDRSFYLVMAVVIASYYDLFAVMGGSTEALVTETLVFSVFVAVAVVGFKTNMWLVVVALVGHGTMDFFHGEVIANPGVPAWWPMFCLTFDVAAGGYLAYQLLRVGKSGFPAQALSQSGFVPDVRSPTTGTSFRSLIRPYVSAELDAASAAENAGDASVGFRHLERAHVLGQRSTIEHVRVHVHMFAWGLRQRDAREIVGQVFRMIGALTITALNAIPIGNTGGSNVCAFRPMPIPSDLANILEWASARSLGRDLALDNPTMEAQRFSGALQRS